MIILIKNEIMNAAEKVGAHISLLDNKKAIQIYERLAEKYTNNKNTRWIWENISQENSESIHDSAAWRWLDDFIKEKSTFLLFHEIGEQKLVSGFEFYNGIDLVSVLAESFNFEFYLTNESINYFICHNHHDVLIAAGEAKEWLQSKINQI
ncbi:MAG: DUF6756 family protein [Candidatus Melainabacteria bacterium]|jgi:hypothetical protein